MFAPRAELLAKDFGISNSVVASLMVSIYMLGLVCGPLLVAPLSELYGRLILYHVCNFVFLAFTLGCSVSTGTGMFLAFRFLAGCAGSAPLTIGGGTIADVTTPSQRGAAMGLFSLGPVFGPCLGPVAGGFIAESVGWRWTFRVLVLLAKHGTLSIATLIFMRETKVNIVSKVKTISVNPGEATLPPGGHDRPSHIRFLFTALSRPLRLLLFAPAILLLNVAVAFAFRLSYLLLTTFPSVFQQQYGFSTGIAGLSYLGMGVAMLSAVVIFSTTSDKLLQWHQRKGMDGPENQLALMALFAPTIPVGFFWYGWAADRGTHWIVPIIGTSFIGFGSMFAMMPVQLYLIDALGHEAAASRVASNTILRSVAAALLPLVGRPLYSALGLGWGNSLLGFLALLFVPVPWLFYRYGSKLQQQRTA
ncbi:MFS transporter [Aspergillus thermomutatus]|uniref:Major facilitator superfamily (MFS) profile domain-containing protein n=1 Tax=Aspergillus thermomutatus TaxID=41047 RepID=A0A397GV50_ASPTH|nr:uncharacterized protein CDV56_107911 [Aspergillus thermomutatus]RHZ54901.1 hypothetical protein CDV56_107911 [Aspergillus thermomutatus]